MLMFKPFEHAFDRSEICFLKRDDGRFCLEVLRPDLSDMTLSSYSEISRFSAAETIGQLEISSKTFKEFTTIPITFENCNKLKPFNRCLNFQARQARLYAIKKGWKRANWDFPDFWSDDQNFENVKSWLSTMDSQSNLFEAIPIDNIESD